MKCCHVFRALILTGCLVLLPASAEEEKNLGLQLAENAPMRVISKTPPAPAPITDTFEIRAGFTLIETLDEFRAAIKKHGQRIRMKPAISVTISVPATKAES